MTGSASAKSLGDSKLSMDMGHAKMEMLNYTSQRQRATLPSNDTSAYRAYTLTRANFRYEGVNQTSLKDRLHMLRVEGDTAFWQAGPLLLAQGNARGARGEYGVGDLRRER